MTFSVRGMRAEDIGEVVAIAAAVPTAPHWPECEFRRMLRVMREQPERRGAWVAEEASGPVCGFAMASHAAGTVELEAVVAAPAYRRRGVGLELTQAVIAWSRRRGAERLVLEARASNGPALGLYARLAFSRDGVRRGYYQNPAEDAVLLSLTL